MPKLRVGKYLYTVTEGLRGSVSGNTMTAADRPATFALSDVRDRQLLSLDNYSWGD